MLCVSCSPTSPHWTQRRDRSDIAQPDVLSPHPPAELGLVPGQELADGHHQTAQAVVGAVRIGRPAVQLPGQLRGVQGCPRPHRHRRLPRHLDLRQLLLEAPLRQPLHKHDADGTRPTRHPAPDPTDHPQGETMTDQPEPPPPAGRKPPPPPPTPEHRLYRDMWIAELWPTCPEYHHGDRPRPYRTAA